MQNAPGQTPLRLLQEAQLLEAKSPGTFLVNIDPAGLASKESQAIEGIQTNTLQMGIIAASSFENLDPIIRVISFPFLFHNEQQAAMILDGPLGAALFRDLETIGCKGLAYSEIGFRQLSNNIRPVKTLNDLHGLKIQVMPSPLHTATWLALGANPTPMLWPIYAELEQGLVDGQENPLWMVETSSFFEVQRYLTLTRHSYIALLDIASLKWWESLNQPEQEMIQDAMVQAARFQRKEQRAKEAARLILFKEKGMIVEEHPDLEVFRSKVAGLKEMGIYREPRVQVLLAKMQEAALQTPAPLAIAEEHPPLPAPSPEEAEPPQATAPEQSEEPRPTDIPQHKSLSPQPVTPEANLVPMQTDTEVQSTPLAPQEEQIIQEKTIPVEPERQLTALELLDAPLPPPNPVQIIHEGQTTSEGETLPPIIEERIPASSESLPQPALSPRPTTGPPQIKAAEQTDAAISGTEQ